MDKKSLICGFLLFVFGFLLLLPVYYLEEQPTEKVNIPCYDRYGSMLQGIDCTEERYINPIIQEFSYYLFFLVLISLMSILLGLFMIIIESIIPKEKENNGS